MLISRPFNKVTGGRTVRQWMTGRNRPRSSKLGAGNRQNSKLAEAARAARFDIQFLSDLSMSAHQFCTEALLIHQESKMFEAKIVAIVGGVCESTSDSFVCQLLRLHDRSSARSAASHAAAIAASPTQFNNTHKPSPAAFSNRRRCQRCLHGSNQGSRSQGEEMNGYLMVFRRPDRTDFG